MQIKGNGHLKNVPQISIRVGEKLLSVEQGYCSWKREYIFPINSFLII